jgi:hypothetical protein
MIAEFTGYRDQRKPTGPLDLQQGRSYLALFASSSSFSCNGGAVASRTRFPRLFSSACNVGAWSLRTRRHLQVHEI